MEKRQYLDINAELNVVWCDWLQNKQDDLKSSNTFNVFVYTIIGRVSRLRGTPFKKYVVNIKTEVVK